MKKIIFIILLLSLTLSGYYITYKIDYKKACKNSVKLLLKNKDIKSYAFKTLKVYNRYKRLSVKIEGKRGYTITRR